jgi:hypothetical protein
MQGIRPQRPPRRARHTPASFGCDNIGATDSPGKVRATGNSTVAGSSAGASNSISRALSNTDSAYGVRGAAVSASYDIFFHPATLVRELGGAVGR